MEEAGLEPRDTAPYLLRLLGREEGAGALAGLTPEAVKRRTFDVLSRSILGRTSQQPLALVIEDLHWIDRTSEEFLASLVDGLTAAPVLFVPTYRPGYRAPWIDRSYVTQLSLPPLSEEDSLAVVRSLLTDEPGGTPLAHEIVRRAEGNPFFLEELAWAARSAGRRADGSVPPTVQGALTARIDRLPAATARTLETAAVLGREAPLRLLELVTGEPDELPARLADLLRLEFLYEQPGPAGPLYVFKHALTQDVAYGRLASSERERLHAAAGMALETLHGEHLDEVLEQLAHHWSQTDDHMRAIEYLTRVGDRATGAYALGEALTALEQAEQHARLLAAGVSRDHAVIDLLVRQGLPLVQTGRLTDVRDRFLAEGAAVDRLGSDPVVAGYHLLLGLAFDHLGDRASASSSARRAVEESNRWGDGVTHGKACWVLSLGAFWSGAFDEGIRHAQRGVELLGETRETWWLGHNHWILGVNAVSTGSFDLARRAAAQTRAVGEEGGDRRLQSYSRWVAGWVDVLTGDHLAGLAACRAALELAPDPLCQAVASQWLGFAHLEAGSPDAAVPLLTEALERYASFQVTALSAWGAAWLSEALLALGEINHASVRAAKAVDLGRGVQFPLAVGLGQRTLGRIARASGALAIAERELAAASGTFSAIGARYELARTQVEMAAVAQALGRTASAHQQLESAHRLLAQLGVSLGGRPEHGAT
jgi:tetratricopeptide (TPR) repeat protein